MQRFSNLAAGQRTGELVLNITGGYKALIPYMTILGQVNNVPIYYIFEDTDQLLRIPQAPIAIDWGIFERYSHVFRELEQGVDESWLDYKQKQGIWDDSFSSCIYEIEENGQYHTGLNAVGEIFWQSYQNFPIVKMPKRSKYFSEEPNRKKQLEKGINELWRRISERCQNLNPAECLKSLAFLPMGDDLRHHDIDDTYIFKFTNPQIRIQYSLSPNKMLCVYNYAFINSTQEDKGYSRGYSQEFEQQYQKLKSAELICVRI